MAIHARASTIMKIKVLMAKSIPAGPRPARPRVQARITVRVPMAMIGLLYLDTAERAAKGLKVRAGHVQFGSQSAAIRINSVS